jgi:alkylated DNA repair dioxygenase AlkB
MGHFPSDAAHSELVSRLLDEVLPDIVERGHVTALTGVEVALRRLNARAAHARLAAQAVARHSLPFRLLSGAVRGVASFSDIRAEVAFSQDTFTTLDGKAVLERRETCWMAEAGIGGLAYSGKIMAPVPLSPAVVRLRDSIEASTGVRFDCCLVNLYADGDCACKFHSDPDHGRVWARDTVVVSIGETRRFVLREITPEAVSVSVTKEQRHHSFHVCDGDAFHMFGACQDDFQHAVLKAEGPDNCGPRASVVFKRALPLANGKKGHGVAKPAAVSVKIVSKGDSVQRGQAHEVKSSKSKRR